MAVVGQHVSRENQLTLVRLCCSITSVLCLIQCKDKYMRTSMIFYSGMEGLGGLDMDTDEDENVCHLLRSYYRITNVTLGFGRPCGILRLFRGPRRLHNSYRGWLVF